MKPRKMANEKTKKEMRERNKERYHTDEEYRKYQNLKSQIDRNALRDLAKLYPKKFEELKRKQEKKLGWAK